MIEWYPRIKGQKREKLAAQLKAQYEKGQSIRDLAESAGCGYSTVHTLLKEAGTEFRSRGGNHGHEKQLRAKRQAEQSDQRRRQ